MLLVIDNRDSFTWNLVHALFRVTPDVQVAQSDTLRLADVFAAGPQALVLSPGPGRPADAGISLELVRTFAGKLPILGVCLGHQVLCEAFGARVVKAVRPVHGRVSRIRHDGRGLFARLPLELEVARYHSLVVDEASLPDALVATAWSDAGELMGVRHRHWPLEAVQFHPESFLTEHGDRMLANFVSGVCGESLRAPSTASLGQHG